MKYLRIILLLLLSFSINLCAQKEETLVVGTTSGYAPFVSLNSEGKYEGFDIDVAELLAKKLNRKLEIKDCGSMPSLMLSLQQKKVDALIWAISITEERMKRMEMVHYQGEKLTELPFLFWKEIPAGINSIADLGRDPKKVVCVEAGTFQEDVLKQFPQIQLKYLDKVMDAVLELRYGKSFATTVDPSLLSKFQAQYPELKVLYLKLPEAQQAFGNGVCLSKKDKDLSDKVRQALAELAQEGKIAELEKKWGLVK